MKILLLLAMTLFFTHLAAQSLHAKTKHNPDFETQGEYDSIKATTLFKNNKKEQHEKFAGTITVIDSNSFKYDDDFLTICYTDKDLIEIFKIGILYPFLIAEGGISKVPKLDTMTLEHRAFYDFARIDSQAVSMVEELTWLRKSYQVKRFKLWLCKIRVANPILYYFELTNDKATRKTKMLDFIRGSKLTFYKQGGLII